MNTDLITTFLPIYPDIDVMKDDIFESYYGHFNNNIYHKQEFYDNRLNINEPLPSSTGQLMKHQKLIARFLSSHTLYNTLLLVHEMGTGKTCSSIGAIEQIKSEGLYKGALYLAKGESLLDNFINELIFKCTDGKYIPQDGDIQEFDKLTDLEKTHRKRKAIKDYYNLNTFETFAKEISRSNENVIRKKYNNRIIIIDEVHNLRIKSSDKGLNIYEQFHTFLHTVENCKIILLSGTPMKDGIDEISSVMNLLLPIDKQLPIGDMFVNTYFNKEDNIYTIKSDMKQRLKDVFKGRVSYLKSSQTDVKKQFEGIRLGTLKYLNVVSDEMHPFQDKVYSLAYTLDTEDRKGVFSNSRQASLFVFPDKTWGKEGFNKYIIKSPNSGFSLKNELIQLLSANTTRQTIENISKYSSKYAATLENIIKAKQQGKLVFIYNEYVQGSGLILFSLLLNLIGYTKASGNERSGDKRQRYAILTNMTSTSKQINKLVNRFNNPDNITGDMIHVIMGSRKISEGFSFKNIQVEEIHTPWFNYSETSQAIARGSRFGSHKELIHKGFIPELKIYQRVSISKKVTSIDLKMYEQSEIKDISIKGVERLIKEASWDCSLTFKRNHITGYDNERECDYMKCDYTCDGIDINDIRNGLNRDELDTSTYQLYYNDDTLNVIIRKISIMFRDTFSLEIEEIINKFITFYTRFEILTSLYKIINENLQITNKYGFRSYLKESDNVFYLVENLSVKDNFLSGYYTEYPNIHDKQLQSYDTITNMMRQQYIKHTIRKISSAMYMNVLHDKMNILPIELQEFFLESALTSHKKNISKNIVSRDLILEYFKRNYKQIDGVYVSWLLYTHNNTIRCMDENSEWYDCNTPEYEQIIQEIVNQVNIDRSYGFYGQVNRNETAFCIRDITTDITDKKHTRTSGRVCKTWKKDKLYDMVLFKLSIPIPNNDRLYSKDNDILLKIRDMDDQTIGNHINKNKYTKGLYTQDIDRDESIRILFWLKLRISSLCSYIKQWFNDNNLLVEDDGCGDTRKTKI